MPSTEKINTRKKNETGNSIYTAIIENSPDCLKLIDFEGRLQFMNIQGQCLMEIDDFASVKNSFWWDMWGEEEKEMVKKSFNNALSGVSQNFIAKCATAKGNVKWWDVLVSPVMITENGDPQLLSISRDITARKEQEDSLRKMASHLKLATESANVGTWSLDMQTMQLEWSPLHKKMWGYNEDRTDLLYEDWHRIILPADKQKAFDKVEEARINHSFYEVEYRIARADNGAIRWIKSSGLYYYSPSGEAFSLTGISIDITQQKINEEKIKESEGRFRLLADIMPLQIWTGDENGSLNYFNNAVYEYSGLTYNDLQKDGWLQMVHPDDREENSKRWMYAVTSGEDFFMEHRFKNQRGEYRWQLSRAKPHKNCDGKIILWVGTSTDIHDSKIKEQQKDEFISIASHEMKTPLTTAKGYLELLLLTLNEAETPHLYASKANQAVQRLHGFVTELLDASKIQNGQLHYNMAAFSFTDLLNETVDNIEHSSRTHTIEKTIQFNKEITGDRNRLMQVLVNLLNNAVKYSPSANKVLLAAKEDNNELVVSVTDFGIGMAKEHLDKVFDRYYRVQEHSVYFQGLGIGLYLSNNIIKRHNGNMWVESEKEKGSTFYFSLPL